MDEQTIKKNIARIRQEAGMSQTDVADKLGISRNAYRALESGATKVLNPKVSEVAAVLNTTTEEIVLGYNPSEGSASRFNDERESYEEQIGEIRSEYESRLAALEQRVADLSDIITALEDSNRTKDEIVSMLKHQIRLLSQTAGEAHGTEEASDD